MGIMDSDPLADFSPLVRFSRDRVGEDEATATRAPGEFDSTWLDVDHHPGIGAVDYFEQFPPARALREVTAKRALLDAYEASVRGFGPGLSRNLLRLVACQATAWNDHPAYLAEWAP